MQAPSVSLRRRELLASSIALLAGVAGCGGGSEEADATSLATASERRFKLASAGQGPWPLIESVEQGAIDVAPPAGLIAVDMRAAELAWLGSGIAQDLLPYAHLEVPSLEHLRALQDAHGSFLGMRCYRGQPLKNNGVRAQASVDFPYQEGETVRYSWRFAIGPDFRADDPANRWWVFAGWHDQPDPRLGETWEGFPSRSTPIGLGYGRLNGQDLLALFYGSPSPVTVALIPFSRGVWHQLDLEIKWSRTSAGRAAVYLDQSTTPAHVASGPNMHNGYQHYLKVGTYRHPDIDGDAWVNVRDVAISRVA